MPKKEIELTPLTYGQFKIGDPYGKDGRVVKVKGTTIIVSEPEKSTIKQNVIVIDTPFIDDHDLADLNK